MAAKKDGQKAFLLPVDLKEQLDAWVADRKARGGRFEGSHVVTAALREFFSWPEERRLDAIGRLLVGRPADSAVDEVRRKVDSQVRVERSRSPSGQARRGRAGA